MKHFYSQFNVNQSGNWLISKLIEIFRILYKTYNIIKSSWNEFSNAYNN